MSLSTSYTFNGKGNWSLDGTGGTALTNDTRPPISISVPEGSVIEKAFLYATSYFGGTTSEVRLSNGANTANITGFTALGTTGGGLELQAFRADVTSFISSVVGDGDPNAFAIDVDNIVGNNVDGYALAIVYSNPAEQTRTIAFLDGASATTGDSFAVNFANPVDTTQPGFEALLSLGIGFGAQPSGQFSTVTVNGRQLTTSAGGQDDGISSNGGLITIGGLGDSPTNPDPDAPAGSPTSDDELYNLALGNVDNPAPYLANGSTNLTVQTLNPSNDDNIFFAAINVTAVGTVTNPNDPPANVAPVVMNDELTPALGACDTGAVLGSDDLQATDLDSTTLTYTLDTLPAGTLLINGEIAQAGATFTQDDINAGLVQLLAGPVLPSVPVNTPNGPISGAGISFADSFDFTVSDGESGSTSGTFTAPYAAFDTVQTAPQYGGYWGGNGNDYQLGTAAADNMSGGNGCDLMIGGAGNDQMHGQEGNNRLFGQDGNDNLTGGNGNDLLDGGTGNDQLHANGGNNWLFGGSGNDTMSAGDGNDRMWGGDGADTINANGGNNRIDAGADNDTVTAGNGNDTIILGTGNDVVFANGGANKFQLGGIEGAVSDGNDQYTGGSGADEYVLFLDDRNDNAAGWGNDVVNGFRIAEGDQLLAFNPVAGFWDDPTSLNALVASDFITGSRGTGGNAGDLTLTFATGAAEQSSLTLKWFFWDNGSFGTTNGSSAISDAQLVSILQAAVRDGGGIASGSDFLAEAHNYVSRDFMLA